MSDRMRALLSTVIGVSCLLSLTTGPIDVWWFLGAAVGSANILIALVLFRRPTPTDTGGR